MKKRKTISLPSMQQIEALYDAGDIAQLRALNERLAKVANQRMAQLYKSGITHSSALERAKYYTQQVLDIPTGGVFSRSKKIDIDTLKEQLQEELIFLRSRTSLVTGERQRRAEKAFKSLTEGKNGAPAYMELPKDIQVPADFVGSEKDYFRDKFLSFLDQDAWKDIKKYLYSADTNLLAEAGEAIARGASIKDLSAAYRDYLRGEVDIYTMWDTWVSI